MKKKFDRDYLFDVLYGEKGKVLYDKITDRSRWSIHHEMVFKTENGRMYRAFYSEGATEMQDESPWEYEDKVECEEVHLVEKTVKVYEVVE